MLSIRDGGSLQLLNFKDITDVKLNSLQVKKKDELWSLAMNNPAPVTRQIINRNKPNQNEIYFPHKGESVSFWSKLTRKKKRKNSKMNLNCHGGTSPLNFAIFPF